MTASLPASITTPTTVLSATPTNSQTSPDDPAPEPPVSTLRPPHDPAPEPPELRPKRADLFEMTFVGDMIFGRYRTDGFDPIAEDGFDVFAPTRALLDAHLVVGNLETPLAFELPQKSPIASPFRFGASAQMAQHLARAGFDAVSVANNHAYDLRRAGLEQTPRILAALGIVGLGSVPDEPPTVRVQTVEREGWRIGFVAVATRLNGPRPRGLPSIPLVPTRELDDRVIPLVRRARASHDLIVVLVHWGEEGRRTPTAAQRFVAHQLVDAGVDLVVGHHPHVLQGIESYHGGVIAYSMGNFLFDNVNEIPRQTGVLRIRARGRECLNAVVFHPVLIEPTPVEHPVPAPGARGQPVKQRLQTLSEPWGTHWRDEGDALVLDPLACPS
ncbi:MAG: CapA family protein [Myxococcota bacterium]